MISINDDKLNEIKRIRKELERGLKIQRILLVVLIITLVARLIYTII